MDSIQELLGGRSCATTQPSWDPISDIDGRPLHGAHQDEHGVFHFADGGLHRDGDLPAVIKVDGERSWYRHDVRHRDGGKPALVHQGVRYEWRVKGQYHREDGPALIVEATPDHPRIEIWFRHGLEHRENGPSMVSGESFYYRVNDLLHRVDGPAARNHDGTESWWLHAKRHRTDGPAVIRPSGRHEYWVDGVRWRAPSKPGGPPRPPESSGEIVTCKSGRRYRLGVRLTTNALGTRRAWIACQQADGTAVMRRAPGEPGHGDHPDAYDEEIWHDPARFHIYLAEPVK